MNLFTKPKQTHSHSKQTYSYQRGKWVHAKVLPLCSTLCDSKDCSQPGSSIRGLLQARILEWVLCSPPEDLPKTEIKPASLTSPALVGGLFTTSTTWEAPLYHQLDVKCFNPYGFFKYLDENSTVGSLLLIVNYSVKPQISLILKIKDDPTILKNFSRFHLA